MNRGIFALVGIVCFFSFTALGPPVVRGHDLKIIERVSVPGPKYKPGEVLVRFRPGVPGRAKAAAHAAVRGQVLREYRIVPGLQHVRLPKGMSVEEGVARYQKNPNVLHAHPNYLRHFGAIPDDPRFSFQWALNNTGQSGGTIDADIDAPEAWDLTTGDSSVVVAVVDSGIDYSHEDLAANMFQNAGDCNSNGLDDDGNGYVDDCYGFNAMNPGSAPMDDVGHGTHVAGIIGAVGNNSIGVAGINWNVRLMACKAGDLEGVSTAATIDCLQYVAEMKDRGVNIVAVNASYSGYSFDPDEAFAIDALRQKGILFVAASGNEYGDNDELPSFPSSYYLTNILAVTATNDLDRVESFANVGRRTVHLGAPGVSILSTVVLGNTMGPACPSFQIYCYLSGTSMAAPHVTGAAALLKAYNPALDWKAIKNLILAGGDDNPANNPGLRSTITQKRLNAYGALTCSDSTVLSRLRPVGAAEYTADEVTVGVGESVDLAVLHINCAQPNGEVEVTVDPGGDIITLRDDGAGPDQVAEDGIYSGEFIPTAVGTYTLTFPGDDVLQVHSLKNYQYTSVPFNYRDITGTNVHLGDDIGICYSVPWTPPQQVGGHSLCDYICLGSNGVISFPYNYNTWWNDPIPHSSAPLLIAPFWDDLKGQDENNVFREVIGTEPNREYVIEWRNVSHYDPDDVCTFSDTVKFQVVFFENSSDILFNYADTSFGQDCLGGTANAGGSATVGIQISSATGTQYSFNSPSLSDNMSILWTVESFVLSPSRLDFGGVIAGVTSAPRMVTLTNETGSTVAISNIEVNGDFAETHTCGSSLAVGASCTVSVTFTPTAAGTRTGELTVTSDAAGSPHTVSLVGSGVAPSVVLSPSSLDFSSQGTGSTSPPESVTLMNDGGATLSITEISTSGDFARSRTCLSSLGAGQSCTINVTFTPTAAGARTGQLTVTTNAASSPDVVDLSGEGYAAPAVSLSPTSLEMGSRPVGTTSVARSVTLTNTGIAALTLAGIQAVEPFARSHNCPLSPGTLAAGTSCAIQVTFTPTAEGGAAGQLAVTSDAPGSPHSVTLTGTGTGPSPVVSLSPEVGLAFSIQSVGTTSPAHPVTLTNTGNEVLIITGISLSGGHAGDFARTHNCPLSPSTLAPAASCAINVTFTPTAGGPRKSAVVITSNAPGSPHRVILTGMGSALSVSPSALNFPDRQVGSSSPPAGVTLTNLGTEGVYIWTTAITGANGGDFGHSSACPTPPASLAGSSSCLLSVTFSPSTEGAKVALLQISHDGGGSPSGVSLTGMAIAPAPGPVSEPSSALPEAAPTSKSSQGRPAVITVLLVAGGVASAGSPQAVSFGSQAVGVSSASYTVRLENSGEETLSVDRVDVSGTNSSDFTESDDCRQSLEPGSSCSVNLFFTPRSSGSRKARLTVHHGASAELHVDLSGEGEER